MSFKSLVEGFASSLKKYSKNSALEIGEQVYSYQKLHALSCQLANSYQHYLAQQSYIGILSGRSLSAFQGVLATLYSGLAYVPFDLKAKPERIIEIIGNTACRVFVVDQAGLELLKSIQGDLEASIFLFPEMQDSEVGNFLSKHKLIFADEILTNKQTFEFANIATESLAYVLFTSGSTGKPKGVPISHKNICAYIKAMQKLYPLSEADRCTQAFDFTFDPSVHDMFVTWFSGACLCVMNDKERLGAQYFIKKHEITVWNTLPSIVKLCLQTRSFSEKYLSNLKYVFFNGEPLLASVVSALQERANASQLINLYGLTETTVNLAHYCWDKERSLTVCRNGIVPIGHIFPGITLKLLAVNAEQESEHGLQLSLSGAQIFEGYLPFSEVDRLKNKNLFLDFNEADGSTQRFMLTGDLVELDKEGLLHIVGRNDEQIKISGHRVDLNIVRYALEKVSQSVDALVLKKEDALGNIKLVACLKGSDFDVARIKIQVNEQLPLHMHLSELYLVKEYPYLVSGKVNKRELLARLSLSD